MSLTQLRPLIIDQLGIQAYQKIASSSPAVVDGYVVFCIDGVECEWGIDTDPVLLRNCDFEMEFTTFAGLLDSVEKAVYALR